MLPIIPYYFSALKYKVTDRPWLFNVLSVSNRNLIQWLKKWTLVGDPLCSSLFFFFLRTYHVCISGTLYSLWGIRLTVGLSLPFHFSPTYNQFLTTLYCLGHTCFQGQRPRTWLKRQVVEFKPPKKQPNTMVQWHAILSHWIRIIRCFHFNLLLWRHQESSWLCTDLSEQGKQTQRLA